ncbi:DUF2269 domain-containing protein [Paenibacillus allorhizosphaerae]|uniref:DUF2269 family protein n=1 Tax=Paenibacillus allorhizosphaerae TaxID=2849866 RepID=A0ABN7TRD5_9BACL|nr:DUF2269 domain-containing protein [Paenibacillus allorhizosphaerae]CAG7652576.1 hypothetical protein PAECIP111802_05263 [Paenibacillus allorhizosphaerae]
MIAFLWTLLLVLLIAVPVISIGKMRDIRLNAKQKKWWVISHVLFVIMYFTGVLGNFVLTLFTLFIKDRELIYAAHYFIKYFDWYLIVPGALGSLATGLWLAVGAWGIINYYWVIVKWVGNLTTIFFGSIFIGTWIEKALHALSLNEFEPMQNPDYLHSQKMLLAGSAVVLAILIFLTAISYLKPWGKRLLNNRR